MRKYEIQSIFFILRFDVGLLYVMELPIQNSFIVDDIFDVSIDFFWDVFIFILSASEEEVHGLDFVALGHLVFILAVLGEEVVLEGEEDDDEKEEVLGPAGHEDFTGVDHVGCVSNEVPMLVMMER